MGSLLILVVVGLVVYYVGKKSTSCGVMLGILAAIGIVGWILITSSITVGGTLTLR